jgi:hypothetical protein
MADEQTYKNHTRFVPMFHIGVLLTLLAYFVWALIEVFQGFSSGTVMNLLLAVGLILMALSLRAQVLTVQDRVIRLEMRLRMRDVLHPELAERAAALPIRQLIALRFASDAELTDLVREVIDGKLVAPKDIKLRVKNWQGDFLRA